MQLISHITKYIYLVFLSCTLLVAWNGVRNNADSLDQFASLATTTTEPAVMLEKPAMIPDPSPEATIISTKQQNDTVWASMSRDFSIDHQAQSQRVQVEIQRIVGNQKKLYEILKAAGPYIYYIYQQTQARGLPAELALIPYIESEFNPNDHSNKGALGLWQLMPQTARELGVRVHSGYDGRKNVITSTKAALAYFNDLGNNFDGNWYLAIAAYNCGQGKVESATRRTGTDNFWKLPLPRETKYYVPRLLAVAEIIKHPNKYGVKLPPIVNKPYFKQVNVEKSVPLSKVAQTSGVSMQTLHKLNPDLKHAGVVVAQKNGAHTLLVPVKNSVTV